MHRRRAPVVHTFRYRLAVFALDLDELDELARTRRLFGVNRGNLVSFFDRDHMDGRAGSTKDKALAFLRAHGVGLDGGRIVLLTQCRMFHYVFNPVSFYYCHHADGTLRAVIAEVNSTFGERHLYLLADGNRLPAAGDRRRHLAAKVMHVSPFISMDAAYEFRLAPMTDRLSVFMAEREHGQPFFDAHLWGRRVELTTRRLAWLVVRYPLLTVQIIAAIHWQALRLYRKGVPVYQQPAPSVAQRDQGELMHHLTKEVEQ